MGRIRRLRDSAVDQRPLDNLEATGAPGVTDDASKGYSVGSRWADLTADAFYDCVDATIGGAVWVAGSGGAATTIEEGVDATSNAVQGCDVGPGVGADYRVRQASGVHVTSIAGGTVDVSEYWDDDDATIKEFTTDQDSVTVGVTVFPAAGAWKPTCTIKSTAGDTPVTLTQVGSSRVFTGSAAVSMPADETFHVETNDGGRSEDVDRIRALDPPLITSLVFDHQGTNPDPYPAIQTAFGNNQTIAYSGVVENHATLVYIKDFEATASRGQQGPAASMGAADSGGTGYRTFSGTCASGNANNAAARLKGFARVSVGSTAGPDFTSDSSPSGTKTVVCSQTYPSLSDPNQSTPSADIDYPIGVSAIEQEALKGSEAATVRVADSNHHAGDTVSWTNNGLDHWQTIIPGAWSGTQWPATFTRKTSGGVGYWDDGMADNGRLVVTRTGHNGHSASVNFLLEIADTAPTVTIYRSTGTQQPHLSYGGARLGSGLGSKLHYIYLASTGNAQKHVRNASLIGSVAASVGTWSGSWASYNDYRYRRQLQIQDGDIASGGQAANLGAWSSLVWYNRAHRSATLVLAEYQVGGFDARNVNFPGSPTFAREIGFSVYVVAIARIIAHDHLAQVLTVNTSPNIPPGPTEYSLEMTLTKNDQAYHADGDYYYWLDTAALEAATTGATHTIEETE